MPFVEYFIYLHELQNIFRSLNIDGRNISFQRNSFSVQTYIQTLKTY